MGRTEALPAWPLTSSWILTSCPVICEREREAFIATDSYEESDLETNMAASNAPLRRVYLSRE